MKTVIERIKRLFASYHQGSIVYSARQDHYLAVEELAETKRLIRGLRLREAELMAEIKLMEAVRRKNEGVPQ